MELWEFKIQDGVSLNFMGGQAELREFILYWFKFPKDGLLPLPPSNSLLLSLNLWD
jgi:hypothetical protein